MDQFVLYTILGLGVGSLYALSAQGLVVVYRGSGVLNFAQGAFALVGAYIFYELSVNQGWPFLPALVAGTFAATALGVALYLFVIRRLRHASPLMRIVATLALLITVQGIATVRYGAQLFIVPNELKPTFIHLWDNVTTTEDRVILIGISIVVTLLLYVTYRFTRFGRSTTAVAENQRAAAALGLSPDVIATLNWALGSALAAAAAILIVPITGLSVVTLTDLALVSLAAALVGGFASFPLTWLGAMVIGVADTQLDRITSITGLPSAVPLVVIILILVVRGRALPLRDYFLQRQPSVGTGRIRWPLVLAAASAFVALDFTLSATWTDAFSTTFSTAIVVLSLVVVAGYAGQISLGQWAIAGLGAFVSGRLVATQGWPFEFALVAGVLGGALTGLVLGVPAVRTRGVNLAIVTLGLGSVVEDVVFNNASWTGGLNGTVIGPQTFFGIDVTAASFSERYALLTFVLFVIAALAVANLRRGRIGRRLLAVRSNERAAAALGIRVAQMKLYAFAVAAGLAGLGGILYAFRNETIVFSIFPSSYSITLVGFAVIGGVGWVGGSILGGQFAVGAIGEQIISEIWPSASSYIVTVSGVLLIAIVLTHPNGVAEQTTAIGQTLSRLLRPGRRRPAHGDEEVTETPPHPGKTEERRVEHLVAPRDLLVEEVTVRYGAVTAVSEVSLTVRPGEVVGLIGPNGAGKTTLIDAISGFVSPRAGRIRLGDDEITSWSAAKRAAAGISRSFQALELFEDMTVLDNLRTAFEPHDAGSYVLDLVYPRQVAIPVPVQLMIRELGLEGELQRTVQSLPYGIRRLLAIARAVATGASIVLLDEPAAGLSDAESRELATIVRRLATDRGIGVLLVEHDVSFVMSVCDRVVVVDFGRQIAEGAPDVVRNDEKVIDAYLGTSDVDSALGASLL